jgi:hypothetical protein
VFLVVAAAETVLRLDVPYCGACVRHVRAFQGGTFAGLLVPTTAVLFIAFFLGIVSLAVTGGGSSGFEMTMMLAMPLVAAALFVVYRLVRRARAQVDRRHASTAPVLRIVNWTKDAVVLDCSNASYALLLRQSGSQPASGRVAAT